MPPQSVSDQNMPGAASRRMRGRVLVAVGALSVSVAAVSLAIYAGLYNVAADIPHTGPVFWLVETVRERSIAVRAADVVVPGDLGDPKRIASGAGQYGEMRRF